MAFADHPVQLVTGLRPGGWPAVREAVAAALAAGVRVVQYREKTLPALDMVAAARELGALCRDHGALLVVNDRLDVALAAGAGGVHLGEDDLPWADARRLAPPPFVIGCSAATPETVRAAIAAGADYAGAGPAYVTGTKLDAGRPLPHRAYGELAALCRTAGRPFPLVAIGGIGAGHAAELVAAGADGIAVVSAIMAAPDPGAAARDLLDEVRAALAAREGR